MSKMSPGDLLDLYQEGMRDFSGVSITTAPNRQSRDALVGADLRGIKLYGANLYRINLREANLSQASLAGAFMWVPDLIMADLSQANLRGVTVYSGFMTCCNLSFADMKGATLRRTDLEGSDIAGTVLEASVLVNIDLSETTGIGGMGGFGEMANKALLWQCTLPNGTYISEATVLNPDAEWFRNLCR